MSNLRDNVDRTIDTNSSGGWLFSALRLLDPVLQYGLINRGWGSIIFHAVGLGSNIGASDGILYPAQQAMLAFSCGAAAKHVIWALFVGEQRFPPSAAITVATFNTIFNTVNTLTFLWCTKERELGSMQIIGGILFGVGILGELISEIQRKRFKSKPSSKGKIFTGGLFSLARHINYGCYVLWRTGYALASGSAVLAASTFAFFSYDFISRGIPVLDEYMNKKYESQWNSYKRATPSKLWPFIY